jgi:hypothetical protein
LKCDQKLCGSVVADNGIVTTAMRFEALPDLPPAGDFVPGYEASQWWAIGLRKRARYRKFTAEDRKIYLRV